VGETVCLTVEFPAGNRGKRTATRCTSRSTFECDFSQQQSAIPQIGKLRAVVCQARRSSNDDVSLDDATEKATGKSESKIQRADGHRLSAPLSWRRIVRHILLMVLAAIGILASGAGSVSLLVVL